MAKHLWVKKERIYEDHCIYSIFNSLPKAVRDLYGDRMYSFCTKDFEKYTRFSCEAGEIHKVRITVEKVK